jgi:hypothetical protein
MRGKVLIGAVVTAIGLVGGLSTSASAATTGKLADVATGYCLDGNGTSAYVSSCNGGTYQNWTLTATSDGYYTLKNGTGKCLDTNTTPSIYMGTCNGGSYQKWRLTGTSSGYRFQDLATSNCVDSNATPRLYVDACNTGNYQKWTR